MRKNEEKKKKLSGTENRLEIDKNKNAGDEMK